MQNFIEELLEGSEGSGETPDPSSTRIIDSISAMDDAFIDFAADHAREMGARVGYTQNAFQDIIDEAHIQPWQREQVERLTHPWRSGEMTVNDFYFRRDLFYRAVVDPVTNEQTSYFHPVAEEDLPEEVGYFFARYEYIPTTQFEHNGIVFLYRREPPDAEEEEI